MLAIMMMTFGCGSSGVETQPAEPGIIADASFKGIIDDSLKEQLEKDFNYVAENCGMQNWANANIKEVKVILMGGVFDCDFGVGKCIGLFNAPNILRVATDRENGRRSMRHESLHYILFVNTGDPDRHHTLDFWKCFGLSEPTL